MRGSGGAAAGVIGALALTGCVGDPGPLSFVRLVPASSPEATRGFLLRGGENTGGNGREMGGVAGDVGAVEYLMSERYRPYLLAGDLEQGITGGPFLKLPRSLDRLSRHEVESPSLWTSFRVYDAGRCSALVPWEEIAGGLVGALDGRLSGNEAVRGLRRIAEGRLTPVLRARREGSPFLSADDDRLRLETAYHADRIGQSDGPFGCDDVTIGVRLEVGFEPVTGTVTHAPDCRFPGEPGGTTEVGGSRDFRGVVHEVGVDVDAGGCLFEGFLREGIAQALSSRLPDAVASALRDRLLRNPRDLGVANADVRPCSCDAECDVLSERGPAYAGGRHRCHEAGAAGECWLQVEPDRLGVRPEGLEVVLADSDADPQMGLYTSDLLIEWFLCSPWRSSRSPASGPRLGEMEFPVSVPVSR